MIKSGILRRLSDLKTAKMTKEFPMLPETLATEQMIERITSDSVDNSALLKLFSALELIEGLGLSLLVLFVNMTGNDRYEYYLSAAIPRYSVKSVMKKEK